MFKCTEKIGTLMDYEKDYVICLDTCKNPPAAENYDKWDKRYNIASERYYIGQHTSYSRSCISDTDNGIKLYIVDKIYQNQIPEFLIVNSCFVSLAAICKQFEIKKVVMEKDMFKGLNWQDVYQAILTNFGDMEDMEIIIVYQEDKELNIIDPDVEKMNYGKDRKSIDGNTQYKYY